MTSRKLLFIVALVAASTAVAKPSKKAPVAPASAKVCETCHGATGVSSDPKIPHLDGQIAEFVTEAMTQFKAGKRPSSTPEHANPPMSPEEVEALAKFYNAQKAERPVQAVDAAKVQQSGALYEKRCAKCHTDNGKGSDHDAPLMAGQSLEYLQAQTQAFVNGKRKFPYLMDEAYQGLTAEELERLSHFFASQR